MKTINFSDLIVELNQLYPPHLAEEWDQVGVHFGNWESPTQKIMTSLDIRPAVINEAIQKNIDTIIVHHPPIFKPIARFDYSTADLVMYSQIIKHDINIFAMHTNLDKAQNGMNDWLAQALELNHIEELHKSVDGLTGLGRIGELDQPLGKKDVLQYIKEQLNAPHLKIIEKQDKESYQRIAIVGGASFESIDWAIDKQADVFITGDITYHKGHDAYEQNILTVDAGHYIEQVFKHKMKQILDELAQEQEWAVEIIESEINTNPYTYV
ncbi:Nif3-like dinuclear metal center hexameric protein [Aerococcaceae bacterium WGS1372]